MADTHQVMRALNLRQGEERPFAVMAAFLFLNTANTTVLSSAKNGLFLSAYPPDLIPYAIIAAALLTAAVAVVFTGAVAGSRRRTLAGRLTAALAISVLGSKVLFELDPRNAFVVYLWLSAVQVLVLTHSWDYASSLLTGRQAKRMLPLIGVGASIGAIAGGSTVAPTARWLGTSNLLWISLLLLLVALPLLWWVQEPGRESEELGHGRARLPGFLTRSAEGIRAVGGNGLLRVLALGLIALTVTGTLIDLQLKFALQGRFDRDEITAIYGLVSAGVGIGTLVLQLWASRVLFPRFGVSFAAMLHGGALVVASAGVAVFGGLAAFLFAQALDDVLQFSLQKPVEQVSLLPFPGRVKSTALATLGGVLRPLSKASGGGIALMLATRPQLLPMATVAAAATAVAAYSRHRERYMKALEGALSRHTVDLSEVADSPLVVDKSMMSIIDRGLEDDDPTVVVFAVSLLDQLPADDALSRLSRLLSHPVPEVRAEAAGVYARIDAPLDFASGMSVAGRLAEEEDPLVVAALLTSVGMVGGIKPESMLRYSEHESFDVRRAGLATLMRLGWLDADERIRSLLESEVAEERLLGASVVGDLRDATYMAAVAGLLEDPTTRPAALEALSNIGSPAVSMFAAVLERTDLPLALRRTVVTALSNIPTDQARTTLVALVGEPDLGPSALHSLTRLRADRAIGAIDIGRLYDSLEVETRSGLLLAACSKVLGSNADGRSDSFVALELQGLHLRSVSRVLRILGLAHDPDRIDKVAESLASGDAAGRSNALELLEGTLDARSAMTVMPFMDLVSEGMPLRRVLDQLPDRDRVQRAPAEVLAEHSDWWPRALALHYLGRDAEVGHPDPEFAQHYEDDNMIPLVEKVMILKGSAFFRHFPGSELGGIAALTQEVHAEDGEVIFEQGDDGDAFYVIVQGSVQILRGETGVATLGAREGFGEMAILDRGERSATARASAPTTLLSLDRDSFDRVIERNPVVARGVYRVLTERLRNTLEKMDTA